MPLLLHPILHHNNHHIKDQDCTVNFGDVFVSYNSYSFLKLSYIFGDFFNNLYNN